MTCRASFGVGVVIVLGVTLRILGVAAYPPGYSYSKFSGPVSGPEHEIIVKGKHGEPAKDYVAKPDYQFSYGVDDPKSKVSQSRKESRNGDEVHGEYSLVEPDGTVRTVKYTADKLNGFQAQVFTNGKLVVHGNTGSDEGSHGASDEGYKVQHDHQGSHSMEQGTYKDGSNSLSSGRSSSEEGYENSDEGEEEEGDDDDHDDDEEDEEDHEE